MVSVWEKFNIQHLTFNIITNVDGEFFVYHHNGVPTIITNSYTVFYCASSWEYFECWLLYSGTISFIFFTIAMSS